MGDEKKVKGPKPGKKKKGLKVLLLIVILLAAAAAALYYLNIPGFKKVTSMSSKVLRMKMPNPITPAKTDQKSVKKARAESAPKKATPKAASNGKIAKTAKAKAASQTAKPVKPVTKEKVAATAKVTPAPVQPSLSPVEIDFEFEMKKVNGLLQQDAKNADALYNRGWLQEKGGNLISAEKDYSEAIQANGNLDDAYFNRGLIYIEMKKYDNAASDFTEVIKMNPRAMDAYCNRGNAYFNLGKRNAALSDYNAALGMDPNDAEIYFNRALIHESNGDQSKAMADFQKASNLGLEKASNYLKPPEAKPKVKSRASSKTPSPKPLKAKAKAPAKAPGKAPAKLPVKIAAKPTPTGTKSIFQTENQPAGSASGKIRGENFEVEDAGIANGILTLRQGSDFFPDYAFLIFLFLKEGEKVDGRTFNITKGQGFGSPHIHMKWKQKDQNAPKTEIFMKDYTMRLEFGKRENGTLPGKISLSLPDKDQSHVNGTFLATIK